MTLERKQGMTALQYGATRKEKVPVVDKIKF